MKLRAWLSERIGEAGERATVPGPSFAYVLGWTLVILFVVEVVTGAALAAFVPRLVTDARGHAEARVKLPDNLTRYRVMAVAAANQNQFGSTESDVTARLPLMVRPSAPRFLNFGDRIELPVVLQNQTDKPLEVEVAMRAANAELTAGHGRRVKVPANDRVEVRFPVAAARPGTARFQVGAVSGAAADAALFQFPVWTPATTEAVSSVNRRQAACPWRHAIRRTKPALVIVRYQPRFRRPRGEWFSAPARRGRHRA